MKDNLWKDRRRDLFISWGLVLVWMGFIFFLSSQPAEQSSKLSHQVTNGIIGIMNYIRPLVIHTSTTGNAAYIDLMDGQVRQYAHGMIYLILSILVNNAFRKSGVRTFKAVIYTMFFCITYACLDEAYQMFVAGRGAELKDVYTDGIGVIGGVSIYTLTGIFNGIYN